MFYDNSRGFRKYMMPWKCSKGPRTKESRWKIYIKFPKNIIFPKGYLFNRTKNVGFHIKSRGPLKNVKTRSGPSSGLGLSICHKTELKSRWTVPLITFIESTPETPGSPTGEQFKPPPFPAGHGAAASPSGNYSTVILGLSYLGNIGRVWKWTATQE